MDSRVEEGKVEKGEVTGSEKSTWSLLTNPDAQKKWVEVKTFIFSVNFIMQLRELFPVY